MILRVRTMWWIILSGILFNFHAYAVNMFQNAFLQRFHEIGLADASKLSAVSLGLAGAIGLLVGGALGDRLRMKMPNGRLVVAAVAMLLAAPCIYIALEQPKGSVAVFTFLMGASSACTFVYYATVYSAIQDVVPSHLRATAVSVYFFAFYVLGASFGPTIMGTLSDRMAAVRDGRCRRERDDHGIPCVGPAHRDVRDAGAGAVVRGIVVRSREHGREGHATTATKRWRARV